VLSPELRKKIIKRLKEVEEGKITHRQLAKEMKVGHSNVCLIHEKDLENRVQALTEKLSTKSQEHEKLSNEVTRLTELKKEYEHYEQNKDEIVKMRNEVADLKSQSVYYQNEIQGCNKRLGQINSAIENGRETLGELAGVIRSYDEQIDGKKTILRQQGHKIEENKNVLENYAVFWALEASKRPAKTPVRDPVEIVKAIAEALKTLNPNVQTITKEEPKAETMADKIGKQSRTVDDIIDEYLQEKV